MILSIKRCYIVILSFTYFGMSAPVTYGQGFSHHILKKEFKVLTAEGWKALNHSVSMMQQLMTIDSLQKLENPSGSLVWLHAEDFAYGKTKEEALGKAIEYTVDEVVKLGVVFSNSIVVDSDFYKYLSKEDQKYLSKSIIKSQHYIEREDLVTYIPCELINTVSDERVKVQIHLFVKRQLLITEISLISISFLKNDQVFSKDQIREIGRILRTL